MPGRCVCDFKKLFESKAMALNCNAFCGLVRNAFCGLVRNALGGLVRNAFYSIQETAPSLPLRDYAAMARVNLLTIVA